MKKRNLYLGLSIIFFLCTGQKIKFLIFSPFCTLPLQPRFPPEGNDPGNQVDFAYVYPIFLERGG